MEPREARLDGSLKRHRDTVVSWLFVVGLVSVLLMWTLETHTGLISRVDRVAYPVMAVTFAAMPLLLRMLPRYRQFLELSSYAAVAGYFAAHLTEVVLGGEERPVYALASILQWLPFLYVVAFVIFSRSVARTAAAGVFIATAMPPVCALLWTGRGLSTDTGMLMLNAYAANFVLLLTLTLITALYDGYERAARQARHLASVAHTDMLTGLANRRGLEHLLDGLSVREGRYVGLVLLDIDHFKSVNDRFGHLIGDELLVMLARSMRQTLDANERAGRWGGEEFLIVVLDADIAMVMDTAERLRQSIEAEHHPIAGQVTVSAGVAVWSTSRPLAQALAEADAALYAAKAQGRNRVVVQAAPIAA